MQINIPNSKFTQTIIVVAIVSLLVMSGAFAWNSFSQSRINTFELSTHPGVNLHDDFDEGPNKDVYVENSGEVGVFVRVRLAEYLQTAEQGSLIAGHTNFEGDEKGWHPHSGIGGVDLCEIGAPYQRGENWHDESFHDYYTWTMGGQKFYKTAVAQLGEDGAFADNPEVCVDTAEYIGNEPDVKQTLWADVITMDQWLAGDRNNGNFWVVDTDGWCYWANTLKPSEATGLLINSVERTSKQFDSNATYCIDVWLQAVDEVDIDLFTVAENGGITDGGRLLTQLLATSYLTLGEDGNYYRDMYNGTFIQSTDQNGKPIKDAKAFVPLVEASVDVSDRLYIDDTLTLTRLVWNGEDYMNFNAFDSNAPYYNIGNGDETVTVVGVETGADDGELYLKLSDGTYITSVTKSSAYSQSYPGTGPFAMLYPGEDGKIGTSDDMRYDLAAYKERFFYHIGNGVYVEVADKNSTASFDVYNDSTDGNPDDNTIYYFSSRMLSESSDAVYEINNMDGVSVDSKIGETFFLTLQIGEQFGYYDAPNTGFATLYKGEEMQYQQSIGTIARTFTMKPIYEHNGDLYIQTEYVSGEDGHYYEDWHNYFIKAAGENGEFGGQVLGVMVQLDEETDEMKAPEISAPMGTGESDNPYRIRSRVEMDWITSKVMNGEAFKDKYFEVMNDFSMVSEQNNTPFAPIGSATTPFKGNFDGDGYTISGLKIEGSIVNQGLFGYIIDAEIKNLAVTGSITSSKNGVGGIVGYATGTSTISGCVFSGTISADQSVGGIVGYLQGGTVENCFVAYGSEITCSTGGGIAGQVINNAKVRNSYSLAKVAATLSSVGGAVANNTGSTVQSCAFLRIPALNNTLNAVGAGTGTNTAVGYFSDLNGAVNATNGTTVAVTNLCDLLDVGAEGSGKAWVQYVTNGSWPLPAAIRDKGFGDYTPLYETGYAGGYGTEVEPYLIATKAQLEYLRDQANTKSGYATNKHFKQIYNIDLNNELWTPIGPSANRFNGHYDGNGYTIKGLNVDSTSAAGLFGFMAGGSIKNLVVEGSTKITSQVGMLSYGGGIVSIASNGTLISDCVFKGTVTGAVDTSGGTNNLAYIGGIAGTVSGSSSVKNCYVAPGSQIDYASVRVYSGGIAGSVEGSSTVISCYSLANVEGVSSTGGVVRYNNSGTVTNCAFLRTSAHNNGLDAIGLVSGGTVANVGYITDLGGALKATNSSTITAANLYALLDAGAAGSGKAWIQDVPNGSWPLQRVIRDRSLGDYTPPPPDTNYASGDGRSEATAYKIANKAQLVYLREAVNTGTDYEGVYFEQTANIDLGNEAWTPIGTSAAAAFKGTYNGGGYQISGLYINSNIQYVGLFGVTANSTIKNLSVKGNIVSAGTSTYLGGIVGSPTANSLVSGCVFSGNIKATYYTGGIAGILQTGSVVKNCYVTYGSEITGGTASTQFTGGIVGCIGGTAPNSTLENSYSLAKVSGSTAGAGGIIGKNDSGTVKNCAYMKTTALNDKIGSAVAANGSYSAAFTNSYVGYFAAVNGVITGTNGTANVTNLLSLTTLMDSAWQQTVSGVSWPTLKAIKQHGWSGNVDVLSLSGSGTSGSPYLISTPAELYHFATWINSYNATYGDKYYRLTNHIDLNGIPYNPIGTSSYPFKGNFDGNGYTISGLNVRASSAAGLFGYANGATIQNVAIKGYVSGSGYTGGVFGSMQADSKAALISGCSFSGAVYGAHNGSVNHLGGIGGYTYNANKTYSISVENCYTAFDSRIISNTGSSSSAGGIIGQIIAVAGNGNTSIKNCYSLSEITGGNAQGGVIGYFAIIGSGSSATATRNAFLRYTGFNATLNAFGDTSFIDMSPPTVYIKTFSGYFSSVSSALTLTNGSTGSVTGVYNLLNGAAPGTGKWRAASDANENGGYPVLSVMR